MAPTHSDDILHSSFMNEVSKFIRVFLLELSLRHFWDDPDIHEQFLMLYLFSVKNRSQSFESEHVVYVKLMIAVNLILQWADIELKYLYKHVFA